MTRDQFLSGAAELVGHQRGMLRRLCKLLAFSLPTVEAISQGTRPVPESYAARLREAIGQADHAGGCVGFLAPRLEKAVAAAEEAGWSRVEALAAVVAWAGLRLSQAAAVPPRERG